MHFKLDWTGAQSALELLKNTLQEVRERDSSTYGFSNIS
jgi:hypothetical protein